MMITLGINTNNDLYLTPQGNIGIKTDLDAMGDIYINKSQTRKGELLFNEEDGIDFFNTIFGEPSYPDVFQNQLISELENTTGTEKISGFTQKTENGIYSYTVNCQTIYGAMALNG